MLECLLGGLIDDYALHLRRANYARLTQQAYLATARKFLTLYPKISIGTVTPEHIERYLDTLDVSARSREVNLEKVRAFFTWAVNRRFIKKNPCDGVVRPRWHPKRRPSVSRAEFEALLGVATDDERALVETLYFTGLRIGELLSVRPGDVDLAGRKIRVTGKGGTPRTVVFPERVALVLASRMGRRWVFYPRDPKEINRRLSEVGEGAGLPYHLTAHLLRHGWVKLMKISGVPIEVTARLAGHSIQTTARVYGQLDEDDLKAVYDRHVEYRTNVLD